MYDFLCLTSKHNIIISPFLCLYLSIPPFYSSLLPLPPSSPSLPPSPPSLLPSLPLLSLYLFLPSFSLPFFPLPFLPLSFPSFPLPTVHLHFEALKGLVESRQKVHIPSHHPASHRHPSGFHGRVCPVPFPEWRGRGVLDRAPQERESGPGPRLLPHAECERGVKGCDVFRSGFSPHCVWLEHLPMSTQTKTACVVLTFIGYACLPQ